MQEDVYVCYGCGWKSSVKRTKPGQFLCNECLKVWEGGKFYPRSELLKEKKIMELPKILYVKVRKDTAGPEDDFLLASDNSSDLSESESTIKVGMYKLVEEVNLTNITTIHTIK